MISAGNPSSRGLGDVYKRQVIDDFTLKLAQRRFDNGR
jgi:hypothetical protein